MDNVELAARALSLAAGEDPDAFAEFEEIEQTFGPYFERKKVKVGTTLAWQKHTREAKAVLMAVGLSIDPLQPANQEQDQWPKQP